MKNLVIWLAILFFSGKALPQSQLKVEHISLEQGVSNNLIYSTYMDSKGILWFGTMFGLVKYDGVNYKTYHYDPLNQNSLSNDDIISIYEDRDGNLWVGTYNGGLNKYDRSKGIFTRYLYEPDNVNSIASNTVWAILQDKAGVMWFATEGGGLNKFENNKFTSYKHDSLNHESISGNRIRSLAEDNDGNIWAGTVATGINKFDKRTGIFTNYRNEESNEKSLSNNFVNAIFKDSDGDMWIATVGGGLNMFNKSSGQFIKFKNNPGDSLSIGSDFVFAIEKDLPGHLLVGTQKGLYKFDKTNKQFERIQIYPEKENKQETVLSFVKDQSGVIWVSTYLDGLHKLYYREDKFKNILTGENVKCILTDKSNTLWAGTANSGLFRSEDYGKNFTNYSEDKKNIHSISCNTINSISEDLNGDMWIGTSKGLDRLNKITNVFSKFVNEPENNASLSSNNILHVLTGKDGTIWIGTDNGLNKFNKQSQSFTSYLHSDTDSASINGNFVLSLFEDSDGELWIGTYDGLNRLNKVTDQFKHYKQNPFDAKSISNSYVFSFCEDASNNLWIGTGGGLNVFDKKSDTFTNFTERDGLPNDVIAGLESSPDGDLWISTYKGLSKFIISNNIEFKNFDTDDGLLSNMFNNGSAYKNGNGDIYFGSINGINYFNPADVKQSSFNAPVIFTALIKYDEQNKNEIDISSVKELELNYKENLINIGFTSLDFSNPKKNKFSYMLEGFDKDWIYSGNASNVVYTNLNPGKYTFKVKGTNSDGVWNPEVSTIMINITPPFWKTWWFYILLISTVTGIIYLLHNYRLRQKVKYSVQIEKIKEKERELMREQASRDYHDELGHKLTRISLYSRRINKKLRPSANGLTQDLNNIVETSNSLQSGAKDLIWAMNPREDTLYDFAVRLRDFGNELFENTGINFSSDGFTQEFRNIILSMTSKRHLIYIFKEGLNNILKYSKCRNVNLTYNLYDEDLEIILEDDGIGFNVSDCPKGYGLKNIFSRAHQINVGVDILSEENTGTKIKLRTNISNLISA